MTAIVLAFAASVSYRIGNGQGMKFWHDNWLGAPLKFMFPALYQLVRDKHSSVVQNAHTGQWRFQHSLLTTTAQSEKHQLLIALQSIQLNQIQDTVTWLRKDEGFSVASAYRFISHTPAPHSHIPNIWKIKAPLRVTIFAWLLLHNRLPTIDYLAKKGWYLPNICSLCRKDAETVTHLFQHYSLAKQLRGYIHIAFADQYSIPQKFKGNASNQMLMDMNEELAVRQWELTTCFILWRERCRRVFSDKELPIIPLVREIRTEYVNWFLQDANSSAQVLPNYY